MTNRLIGTAIALVAPIALLFAAALLSGSADIGSREFTFVYVLWAVGLAIAWWPRRTHIQK